MSAATDAASASTAYPPSSTSPTGAPTSAHARRSDAVIAA